MSTIFGQPPIREGHSRRTVLKAAFTVSVACLTRSAQAQSPDPLMTRSIPHSGEQLPVVGLGTSLGFRSPDQSKLPELKEVVDALVAGGGKLIDTASAYGNAESVL